MSQYMYQCPVPGCEFLAMAITSNHYASAHNMEKAEVIEQHGKPTINRGNEFRANANVGKSEFYNKTIIPYKEYRHKKDSGYL